MHRRSNAARVLPQAVNTGEHLFQVPADNNPLVREHRALEGVDLGDERLGIVGAPGPMVTAGRLVFFSGGADHLFAIDKTTGEELWAHPLGASSSANPMTCESPAGEQFVVIAVGRGATNKLVAFSLGNGRTAGGPSVTGDARLSGPADAPESASRDSASGTPES